VVRCGVVSPQSIPSRLVELVGFVTTSRLCGELSVSRAFGDVEYKGTLKNEYWGRSFTHVQPPWPPPACTTCVHGSLSWYGVRIPGAFFGCARTW
jgi:hypothetical protein